MLEARNIGLRLGDRWLWRELSMSIEPGQIVGILGRNGTGKTTLLRALTGARPIAEGTIEAVRPIGYVPQMTELSFPFTAREVVTMGRVRHLRLFDRLSAADERVIDRAIEQTGIRAFEDREFPLLSGGERQLTLVARALAAEARLLLLDEPMASLDLDNQHRLMTLMSRLARDEKLGLLFVTHNPDHVFAVSDKVLLLRENAPALFGDVSTVLTEQALTDLYGLQVHLFELQQDSKRTRHAVPLF